MNKLINNLWGTAGRRLARDRRVRAAIAIREGSCVRDDAGRRPLRPPASCVHVCVCLRERERVHSYTADRRPQRPLASCACVCVVYTCTLCLYVLCIYVLCIYVHVSPYVISRFQSMPSSSSTTTTTILHTTTTTSSTTSSSSSSSSSSS